MPQWIIGTDEAGYGPNLGPLVVSASAWHLPRANPSPASSDPQDPLVEPFENWIRKREDAVDQRILVGDSKKVYQAGSGIGELERSVLTLIGQTIIDFRGMDGPDLDLSWSRLVEALDANQHEGSAELPWYHEFDPSLPLEHSSADLNQIIAESQAYFQQADLHSHQASRLVEPACFNRGIEKWGNKATLLSMTTLGLVRDLLERRCKPGDSDLEATSIQIVCDRHGGRKKYASLLQEVFPDSWVRVLTEEDDVSIYAFEWNQLPTEIRFQVKGDSRFLSIAWASMISKYLREVCMKAFNDFWQQVVPGISPTAGYPQDARRFRSEIHGEIQKLELEEANWWRFR